MTPLEALLELLERVGGSEGGALVSEEELSRWPAEAIRGMKSHKLLVRASPATTVVCSGCEQECTMPVHTISAPGKAASFVVCDKRDDINRVSVTAGRLRQWRCGAEAVGAFVAQSLEMRPESQRKASDGLWELGLATGKKRSLMLCLRANGALELMAGSSALPLPEVVRYGTKGYSTDSEAILQLVDTATVGDPRYTPSVVRREARKLKTQAMYENWHRAYLALKQSRPEMSDVWCSQQIARRTTAKGHSAETIRKHLKR